MGHSGMLAPHPHPVQHPTEYQAWDHVPLSPLAERDNDESTLTPKASHSGPMPLTLISPSADSMRALDIPAVTVTPPCGPSPSSSTGPTGTAAGSIIGAGVVGAGAHADSVVPLESALNATTLQTGGRGDSAAEFRQIEFLLSELERASTARSHSVKTALGRLWLRLTTVDTAVFLPPAVAKE